MTLRADDGRWASGGASLTERFWRRILRDPGGCWIWQGRLGGSLGYGYFSISSRKSVRAHRWAYETYVEPIPDDMLVLHSCDNPPCVNPAHLHLGAQIDNVRECHERRRIGRLRGSANRLSKLSSEQIRDIRSAYAGGDVLQRELAVSYGVGQRTISRIVLGQRYLDGLPGGPR